MNKKYLNFFLQTKTVSFLYSSPIYTFQMLDLEIYIYINCSTLMSVQGINVFHRFYFIFTLGITKFKWLRIFFPFIYYLSNMLENRFSKTINSLKIFFLFVKHIYEYKKSALGNILRIILI